ncbi:UNVERIFIED_CONTAM: calpain family cysteine protease domain-containing protein [Hammondia hammondi]|eukprot:XP_008884762.1 calpain family cysteine protease domain-containing protein [Hammondia hammondi]
MKGFASSFSLLSPSFPVSSASACPEKKQALYPPEGDAPGGASFFATFPSPSVFEVGTLSNFFSALSPSSPLTFGDRFYSSSHSSPWSTPSSGKSVPSLHSVPPAHAPSGPSRCTDSLPTAPEPCSSLHTKVPDTPQRRRCSLWTAAPSHVWEEGWRADCQARWERAIEDSPDLRSEKEGTVLYREQTPPCIEAAVSGGCEGRRRSNSSSPRGASPSVASDRPLASLCVEEDLSRAAASSIRAPKASYSPSSVCRSALSSATREAGPLSPGVAREFSPSVARLRRHYRFRLQNASGSQKGAAEAREARKLREFIRSFLADGGGETRVERERDPCKPPRHLETRRFHPASRFLSERRRQASSSSCSVFLSSPSPIRGNYSEAGVPACGRDSSRAVVAFGTAPYTCRLPPWSPLRSPNSASACGQPPRRRNGVAATSARAPSFSPPRSCHSSSLSSYRSSVSSLSPSHLVSSRLSVESVGSVFGRPLRRVLRRPETWSPLPSEGCPAWRLSAATPEDTPPLSRSLSAASAPSGVRLTVSALSPERRPDSLGIASAPPNCLRKMGCQCSTQRNVRRPESPSKSQSDSVVRRSEGTRAGLSSTPATVEGTPREAKRQGPGGGEARCEAADGEPRKRGGTRAREEAGEPGKEEEKVGEDAASEKPVDGTPGGVSSLEGRAGQGPQEPGKCGVRGDTSHASRETGPWRLEERENHRTEGSSPPVSEHSEQKDLERNGVGEGGAPPLFSRLASSGLTALEKDVHAGHLGAMESRVALSAAGGRKRRGEEVKERGDSEGHAPEQETLMTSPARLASTGAMRVTESRRDAPPSGPALGTCSGRGCPRPETATSGRGEGRLRSCPSRDGSPAAIFSSPYKRRSSGRQGRGDEAGSAAPIAGACSRPKDGKVAPGVASSSSASGDGCSEGGVDPDLGSAARRRDSSRSLVRRRVSSASPSRPEGPSSGRFSGSRPRHTQSGCSGIVSQGSAFPAALSQWQKGACVSKTGADSDAWCCLSPLAYSQQKLLPSHLSGSLAVSEILLESSIVGRYVMLPWNEEDGDIRQNFYVHCPPPVALCSPLSQSVAMHASTPPPFPSDPSRREAIAVCPVSPPCGRRDRAKRRSEPERGDGRGRDELESGMSAGAKLAPETLVKSTQESPANGRHFASSACGDARAGREEVGITTEKSRWTKRSYPAPAQADVTESLESLSYGFGGFPQESRERRRRNTGGRSREVCNSRAQGRETRTTDDGAVASWMEGEACSQPCPRPPACCTSIPLASASSSAGSSSFAGAAVSDPVVQTEAEGEVSPGELGVAGDSGEAPACDLAALSPSGDPGALGRCEEWGPDGKWTDPDGVMSLSRKQQQKFAAWKRLSEIVKDPVVIQDVPNSRAIRQGFVGDCSFLSSLAVLSEFERKHNVPVLSGLLYPQGTIPAVSEAGKRPQAGGERVGPIFNPRGMYACRLYFNGVPRKVLIDDYVPVRKDNKLLAAHSSNKSELWVTLLEKAFVKLMGGSYSMQGSNPGADLYHLTGWIPETIPFRSDVHTGSPASHKPIVTGRENEDDEVVKDPKWTQIWTQLYLGLTAGRCVACLGTSEVSDAAPSGLDFPEGVSVSSGIVARHAYSILNYAEIEGHRLLYVKNPWGCVRWKGKFSPSDKASWTQNMKEKLGYDPATAAKSDCGCFWIEWLDVVRWFSHLYVCWDNSCFPYQAEIHSKWERSPFIENSSLADDSHMVAFNPQFHLRISPRPEDFASSALAGPYPFLSFPSLTSPASAASLPMPSNSPPGTPHTASLSPAPSFSQENQPVELWILLSRHVRERQKDLATKYLAIHLHAASERATCPPPPAKQGVYSNGECTLVKLRVHPHVFRDVFARHASDEDSRFPSDNSAEHEEKGKEAAGSRPPLPGFEGHQLLDASEFVLVVSQYSQKDEFNFTIKVYGHVHSCLTQLPPLLPTDAQSIYFKNSWGPSTAGGCSNDLWRYFTNPHIRLKVPQPCDAIFFLESPQEHSVNLRLFKNRVATARLLRTGKALSTGPYRAGCCMLKARLEATTYTIIPSTFRPDDFDTFQLSLHVPGNVAKPRPLLLPQPYAIPPPSSLFYRVVDGRKCTRQVWARVALQVQGPTLVALRLQMPGPPEPGDVFPSLTVYRYTETAEREREVESEKSGERKSQKKLQFVIRSDLDGGLSEDGHTASSAAQDLFLKQGVVNVSSVELLDPLSPYVIFISTLNGDKDADGCPLYAHSRDVALHYLHRCEGRQREDVPKARPWMLHVIADRPLDVQLLL